MPKGRQTGVMVQKAIRGAAVMVSVTMATRPFTAWLPNHTITFSTNTIRSVAVEVQVVVTLIVRVPQTKVKNSLVLEMIRSINRTAPIARRAIQSGSIKNYQYKDGMKTRTVRSNLFMKKLHRQRSSNTISIKKISFIQNSNRKGSKR